MIQVCGGHTARPYVRLVGASRPGLAAARGGSGTAAGRRTNAVLICQMRITKLSSADQQFACNWISGLGVWSTVGPQYGVGGQTIDTSTAALSAAAAAVALCASSALHRMIDDTMD